MSKIKVEQKVKLHNKFHLVLTDVRTGKVKQEAWAYNIILNQGLKRLTNNGLGASVASQSHYAWVMRPGLDTTGQNDRRFGGFIYVGKGTGELSAANTTLFDYLDCKYTSLYDREYDIDTLTASYVQYASWDELELQNEDITEIGLGSGNTSAFVNTHALIVDSEGNPIIVAKGEFDILTVYSTVFIELEDPDYGDSIKFVEGNDVNFGCWLLDWIYRNAVIRASADAFRISVGYSDDAIQTSDSYVKELILNKHYRSTDSELTVDDVNYKWAFDLRISADEGNHANGIREIGLSMEEWWPVSYQRPAYQTAEFITGLSAGYGRYVPAFRAITPIPTVWPDYTVEGEELGTGDGVQDTFDLQWSPIVAESETIKVNDVAQVRGTDYTINNTTGQIVFEAGSIPAEGHAVVGDYDLSFIPKDENHVLDISFEVQFADGNIV